jgi:hypothetical protein
MKGLRLAGILWLVGGVMSVVLTIVFRTDALQWVLTIASGLVAVALGLWLSVRPNPAIVPRRNRPANSSPGPPTSSLRSSESRQQSSLTQPRA